MTEELFPYNYQEGGINKGFSVEIFLHIVRAADYTFERKNIRQVPWDKALEITKMSLNTLLFSVMRTPERESLFQWVGLIGQANDVVLGLKKHFGVNKFIVTG